MEKFQVLREDAKKKIRIADHMLTITFPLVQDPKLLLAILENVFLAQTNAMSSVLEYERLFKRVPPFHDTFDSKFNLFRSKIAPRFKIDPYYLKMMKDIKAVIVGHKQSPMEFVRKDKFVICSNDYQMKTLNTNDVKKYIASTKKFVKEMEVLVSKNDQIFRSD
ncbi:MAG: hypothetical protein ABIE94_03035 [archaeon]